MENVKPAEQTLSMSSDTTHTPVRTVTLGLKASAVTQIANSALNVQNNPMNPNPTCDKDCRFHYGVSMTTAMYFAPVFDKHGNNLNPDGNITSSDVSCSVCGKKWISKSQYGKTEYFETEDPVQESKTSV